MNKYEKEVHQEALKREKEVLNRIKANYEKAILEIEDNIARLLGRKDADMQHVIYQIEYQKALLKQNEAIYTKLQSNNFRTASEYLAKCYEDGFIGAMYDLQGQGIPLIIPIDQAQVVEAIKTESKLSEDLYDAFDMKELKKQISAEISRGISSEMTFGEISRNIENRAGISQNNAIRIVRTEGHRIQCTAQMHGCEKAQSRGADIVKQWDSSLDGKTRDSHRRLDGQIREIDDPFEIDGMTAMHPSGFGVPSEDINCRCVLNQRARWALDQDELDTLKERAEYFGLDKSEDFAEYKKKYLEASERVRSDAQKIKGDDSNEKSIASNDSMLYNEMLSKEKEAYKRLVDDGSLTPLADFELFQKISNEIDEKLVGMTTPNGIEITGKSDHYIARTIGSVEQKRNGVSVDKAISIITTPDRISAPNMKNGAGQKYIKEGVGTVTINPKTGNLIQVNPLKSKGKDK